MILAPLAVGLIGMQAVGLQGESSRASREVTLDVDEISDAPLALAADGSRLELLLLGDRVDLPAAGGEARQLTRGPRYDDPPPSDAQVPGKYRARPGERVVWSATAADGSLSAARVATSATAPGHGEWIVVLAHGTEAAGDQELLRQRVGPVRQASSDARPAFGRGSVYFTEGGHLRAFDVATRKLRDLPFHARVVHELPVAPAEVPRPTRWTELDPLPCQGVLGFDPSPDGDAIVFALQGDLWIKEGDETPRPLTSGPEQESNPQFTLAGDEILFCRDSGLWRMPRDGGTPTRVATLPASECAFDVEGQHALTAGTFNAPGATLHDLASGSAKLLVQAGGRWSVDPAFGPDGVVVATLEKAGVAQIVTLHPAGGSMEVVTKVARPVSSGRISPDGRFIAFLRDGHCWIGTRRGGPVEEGDLRRIEPIGANRFVFGADSDRIWVARGPKIAVHDCATGRLVREIDLTVMARRPAVAPPACITNVTVVDVEQGILQPDMRVELAQGRIARLLPEAQAGPLPAGATVVQGAGRFLIPGLVDMHTHGTMAWLESLAAYGITRVRDVGGAWPVSWASEEEVVLGRRIGPRQLFAAEIFEGAHPVWGDGFHVCETDQEALALLADRAARGIDLVKVYPTLDEPMRGRILGAALAQGLLSSGHADDLRLIVTEIEAGIRCLEHIPVRLIHGDVIALMKAAGTVWCPTLCVMGGGDWKLRRAPQERTAPRFLKAVPQSARDQGRFGAYYAWAGDPNLDELLDERCRMIARAAKAGVPVLVGTDAPNSNCFHGPGTHWEMEFLVRGGLTPAEALRAATSVPRRACRLAHEGTIAPGMAADLVLLSADPLAEIRATQQIELVFLAGRAHSPEEILGEGVKGY